MKVSSLDESPASLHAARVAVRFFGPSHPEFLVLNVARFPVAWIDPAGFGSVDPLPPLEWEQVAGPSSSELAESAEGGMGGAEVLTESGDPATCSSVARHPAVQVASFRRRCDPGPPTGWEANGQRSPTRSDRSRLSLRCDVSMGISGFVVDP